LEVHMKTKEAEPTAAKRRDSVSFGVRRLPNAGNMELAEGVEPPTL
jgi:hypothetical protein